MSRIYEFLDKHYCEKDLSDKDDLYAGDLDDLWNAMCDSGYFYETTYYCTDNICYESIQDLIENEVDYTNELEDEDE